MMPLLMGRPRLWSGRSARTRRLVAVSFAVAAALVACLCFFVGRDGAVASDFPRMTAAAGARPYDQLTEEAVVVAVGYAARRLLSGGPGSHPPRCTSKCGGCSPCYAVHVPVPPGVFVATEYYPEAWRCKCQNQLYMP